MTYLLICVLSVFSVALGDPLTTEKCIAPLLVNDDYLMCQQMDEFTQCYIDTDVPSDSGGLFNSLQAMSEIMDRFKEEQCDLNKQFNNECPDDFVDCLSKVTAVRDGKVHIDCRDSSFQEFLVCTDQTIPGASTPCYFREWQQLIVNRTRDLVCTDDSNSAVAPAPPVNILDDASERSQPGGKAAVGLEINGRSLGTSSGSCQAGGLRYHAYKDCTIFRVEWIQTGIFFPPQQVAPGTLFDINICGQNHAYLVSC